MPDKPCSSMGFFQAQNTLCSAEVFTNDGRSRQSRFVLFFSAQVQIQTGKQVNIQKLSLTQTRVHAHLLTHKLFLTRPTHTQIQIDRHIYSQRQSSLSESNEDLQCQFRHQSLLTWEKKNHYFYADSWNLKNYISDHDHVIFTGLERHYTIGMHLAQCAR